MARNTLSNQGPRKGGKKASSGSDRGIVLVLAGFTAAAIVIIALFAVVSTAGSEGASNFTPNDQGLLPTGTQAPEFTADTVDSGSDSVGENSADATMLVFFATWCPHCQNEAPIIRGMENEYEDLRIVMIGIDNAQGDNPDKVRQFMEQYNIQSPAVYEPSLGAEYQVSGYPTVYVPAGNAEIVAANSGEAPKEVYEE